MVGISSESTFCYGRQEKGSISQPGLWFLLIQRYESICFCLVVPLGFKQKEKDGIWVDVKLMTFCHYWCGVDSTKDSSPPSHLIGTQRWDKYQVFLLFTQVFCFVSPSFLFFAQIMVHSVFIPHPNVTGKYKERECYSFHYVLLAWGEKSKRPQHCCFTVHYTPFCKGQKLLLSVPLQVWNLSTMSQKIYLKQLISCWATLSCIVFQTWHQHATNYPFYSLLCFLCGSESDKHLEGRMGVPEQKCSEVVIFISSRAEMLLSGLQRKWLFWIIC